MNISTGARLLIIPTGLLSPPGLGLLENVVGVPERGGEGARGEGLGLGFDIMEEIMSEGFGLGAGLGDEAADEDEDGAGRG